MDNSFAPFIFFMGRITKKAPQKGLQLTWHNLPSYRNFLWLSNLKSSTKTKPPKSLWLRQNRSGCDKIHHQMVQLLDRRSEETLWGYSTKLLGTNRKAVKRSQLCRRYLSLVLIFLMAMLPSIELLITVEEFLDMDILSDDVIVSGSLAGIRWGNSLVITNFLILSFQTNMRKMKIPCKNTFFCINLKNNPPLFWVRELCALLIINKVIRIDVFYSCFGA